MIRQGVTSVTPKPAMSDLSITNLAFGAPFTPLSFCGTSPPYALLSRVEVLIANTCPTSVRGRISSLGANLGLLMSRASQGVSLYRPALDRVRRSPAT